MSVSRAGDSGSTMTPAVVFSAAGRVDVEEIAMALPGPGEVRVRSRYSGVSAGTEGWCLEDTFTWARTPYPCVPGYQRVGTIEALGAGVTGLRVGQSVLATIGTWTGPVKPFWGSHVAVGNSLAAETFPLAPEVDELDAAHAVVAQVGFNAASRVVLGAAAADQWVVVYGDGLIGQMAAQAARARGARVIVVGHREARLKLALAHSADAVVNNHTADVREFVKATTGRETVTAVIDTVQSLACEREYVPLLGRGVGQVVYSGFTPGDVWSDMGLVQRSELTCHHVSGWTRERLERTLALMAAGKLRVRPLTTHLVGFGQAGRVWEMIRGKREEFTGVTFDWEGATQ